jgi:hypothetical protein
MFSLLLPKKYGGTKRSAACWKIQGVGAAHEVVQVPAETQHSECIVG